MFMQLAKIWEGIAAELFDREGFDALFMHARNVLTGAAVVAAGVYAVHHVGDPGLVGMWNLHLAGYVVAAVGALLLLLNLIDGLRRLAQRRHPLLLRIATVFLYVVISMRLTQVIIYFRASA
jgi:hypothetical protein